MKLIEVTLGRRHGAQAVQQPDGWTKERLPIEPGKKSRQPILTFVAETKGYRVGSASLQALKVC